MFKRLQTSDGVKLNCIVKLGFLGIDLWTVFENTSIMDQTACDQSCLFIVFYADFKKIFSIFDAAEG